MAQRGAFAPEQRLAAGPQLVDLTGIELIQQTRQRSLLGKARAAPGLRQGVIRAQPRVDLRDGPAAAQHRQQHIEQLIGRSMRHRLHGQGQLAPQHIKEVGLHETVTYRA
jgi:hypothetical protein